MTTDEIKAIASRAAEAVLENRAVPEAAAQQELGHSIAKQLAIHYDGIQEGYKDIPAHLQFTDPLTHSTFYGNSLEEVRANLENMRADFAKAEPKQEEKPCPNLQPMAEWIKGETPGTCRPCILTPVVQWYWQELKEQGDVETAAQLAAEVDVLEEDNVEQVMAICKDLDEIKAAALPELRKRLEEFDCSIQSFDPDEIVEEAPAED